MSAERSGCLKFLGPLANLLAVKDKPPVPSHFVKTSTGIKVGVPNDVTNDKDYAEVVARTFKSGKPMVGYYDEAAGEFKIKEVPQPELPKPEIE